MSSIFFSVLHLTNLAGGISIEYAIAQIIFAFIFAVISAQLTVITNSLIPAIVWHFSHDFITLITGDTFNSISLILLIIQCISLIIYSLYLNKKITKEPCNI